MSRRETKEMKPTSLDELAKPFLQLQTFADVKMPEEAEEPILHPAVRAAVFEWITEIRAVKELEAMGVKPRRSALFYGPPGTGKTTLAHHIAARLGVPLVSVNSEQLIDSSLGGSQRNVAKLFNVLDMVNGKCVMLLDEIDSIGSKRSADDQAGAREMNSVLTTLLRKVESFTGIMIGATNRNDALDPALWRRFGLQLSVDLPSDDERYAIMRRYIAPLAAPDEDLDLLVDLTRGASPALLRATMEGIKRTLVIGPRIGRDVSNAAAVFASVIASNQPHPDIPSPRLWTGAYGEEISAFTWPWVKESKGSRSA